MGKKGRGAAPGVEATLPVRRARRRVQIWTFTMSKSAAPSAPSSQANGLMLRARAEMRVRRRHTR
jgi:hypothetical protein